MEMRVYFKFVTTNENIKNKKGGKVYIVRPEKEEENK